MTVTRDALACPRCDGEGAVLGRSGHPSDERGCRECFGTGSARCQSCELYGCATVEVRWRSTGVTYVVCTDCLAIEHRHVEILRRAQPGDYGR